MDVKVERGHIEALQQQLQDATKGAGSVEELLLEGEEEKGR